VRGKPLRSIRIPGEKSQGLEEAMKAIVQEHYGSHDDLELREVAKPVVVEDDVLV